MSLPGFRRFNTKINYENKEMSTFCFNFRSVFIVLISFLLHVNIGKEMSLPGFRRFNTKINYFSTSFTAYRQMIRSTVCRRGIETKFITSIKLGRRLREGTLKHMRTAQIQTSLRFRAVWSGTSLFAYIIKGSC